MSIVLRQELKSIGFGLLTPLNCSSARPSPVAITNLHLSYRIASDADRSIRPVIEAFF